MEKKSKARYESSSEKECFHQNKVSNLQKFKEYLKK